MRSVQQESATPLTGCCSSLSAQACSGDEALTTECFDCNQDYTATLPHETVSADDVRRCINDYHGLCLSDEQLDGFVASQQAAESSLELMITS